MKSQLFPVSFVSKCEQELFQAVLLGDLKRKADILNDLGNYHDGVGEQDTALYYYNLTLQIDKQLDNDEGKCSVLYNIGRVLFKQVRLDEALESFQKSLGFAEQFGDWQIAWDRVRFIAEIYRIRGEYDKEFRVLCAFESLKDNSARLTRKRINKLS